MITLYGMYKYEPTLFDGIQLPEGMVIQTQIDDIIMYCGECFPLYQNAPMLKQGIARFFDKNKDGFKRLYNSTQFEYDPISNYDRIEDSTDNNSGTNRNKSSGSGTTTETPNLTNAHNVSAYDSQNLVPDYTDTASGTDSTQSTNTANSNGKFSNKDVFHSEIKGNIGVTTTQNMIQQERDIAIFDVYREISKLFEKELMIRVY